MVQIISSFQKYNLLFFGLAEEPDEDPEQLVRNILQTKMDIILKDKDIEFAEVRLFWGICIPKVIAGLQTQPFSCIFSYKSTKTKEVASEDLILPVIASDKSYQWIILEKTGYEIKPATNSCKVSTMER